MSEDGVVVVLIALVGNPFSPAYARARQASPSGARALDFCAMNVAVYGPRARAWSLREVRMRDNDRGADGLAIGASTMRWSGDCLVVDVHEKTTPFGRPIRGRVTFRPAHRTNTVLMLDDAARHRWRPCASAGEIDVALLEPRVNFRGAGYHDMNDGDAPLERDFSHWNWSRAAVDRATSLMTYDVVGRDGAARSHAFVVDPAGEIREAPALVTTPLARTGWRIDRSSRVHAGAQTSIVRELEDTPFYARALMQTHYEGRKIHAIHETLSAARLRRMWVRFLLGFRMGREERAR